MTRPKVARWLDLVAFLLQHHYPVTREQIFAAVSAYRRGTGSQRARESVRRMFERDKDELKRLGIAIQTVPLPSAESGEAAEAYRLPRRDFYLPYLELVGAPVRRDRPYPGLRQVHLSRQDVHRLDRATARLAAHPTLPLAAAAASARRKLGFDLPLSLAAVERVLARPLHGEAAGALAVLQRAVAERHGVRCEYWAIGRNTREARTIEPLGLFYQWGRWYAVARDRRRAALRVFRVDRMRHVERLTGAGARFAAPAEFDVRAYVGRAPWELSESAPVPVRARFAFPESRWVLAERSGTAVEPVLEDGGAVIEFAVRDRGPFLRWALTFGERVEIVAPDDVRRDLESLRTRVAELYARAP